MPIRVSSRCITVLAATVLLATVAACGGTSGSSQGGSSASALIPVTASYVGDYESTWPVAVALKEGFFKDAGLKVTPEEVVNGPTGIAAMQSGHLNFVFIGPGPIRLAMTGNAVIIGSSDITTTDYVISRPNITNVSQLKGQTVLYSAGTVDELMLAIALGEAGLKLSDVHGVNIPDFATVGTAFLSGSGSAIALSNPFSATVLSKDPTAHVLLKDGNLYPKFAFPDSWVTTRTMLNDHPGTVERFLWAVQKANDWVIGHYQESYKILETFTKQPFSEVISDAPPNNAKMLPTAQWIKNYQDGTAQKWYETVGKADVQAGILTAVPPADAYLDFGPAIAASKKLTASSFQ